MELKSPGNAIEAYRTALSLSKRDYRGWYGLGQVYELLNLYSLGLYYYKRAVYLRPKDSRLWVALGSCCLASEDSPGASSGKRNAEALRCFAQAVRCGDSEGIALAKLAKLHAQNPAPDSQALAARAYSEILSFRGEDVRAALGNNTSSSPGSACFSSPGTAAVLQSPVTADVVDALRFLMGYARGKGQWSTARDYALRLLEFGGSEREEAKQVLRESQGLSGNSGLTMMSNPLGINSLEGLGLQLIDIGFKTMDEGAEQNSDDSMGRPSDGS